MSVPLLSLVLGVGASVFVLLIVCAFGGDASEIDKRLARVGGQKPAHKIAGSDRINSVRSTKDSAIPLLDRLVKALPNPDKLRDRLAATGGNLTLGEYLLINALSVLLVDMVLNILDVKKAVILPASVMFGLGLPHFIVGWMVRRRHKKFLGHFPEAIDTMCRGIRSGLPITESIAAVGRELPDPVGMEFLRISDGVRMGKTLEASMWEVARRISVPEFRFLIIAMAIQKETGGNLGETLGNLSELIRKRRQLKQKVKAMSSEAKASAMIIGSLPFIMFTLLLFVNYEYVSVLFTHPKGQFLLAGGLFWMSMGWGVMAKMINFEL